MKNQLIIAIALIFILLNSCKENMHSISEQHMLNESLIGIPISFEPNIGQVNEDFKFVAYTNGYKIKFNERAFEFERQEKENLSFGVRFLNPNPNLKLDGKEKLIGKSNYIIGNDREKWFTNVANFSQIEYKSIYNGVDLVFYSNDKRMEFDFIVSPDVDIGKIKFSIEVKDEIEIDSAGNLVFGDKKKEIIFKAPKIYQVINDVKKPIQGEYVIDRNLNVGFEVGDYDKSKTLIIDPVIEYATYIESSSVRGIVLDKLGNIFLTGTNGNNAFIQKINSSCTAVIFNTIVGGSGTDRGNGIVIDKDGNSYIAGYTTSDDFAYATGSLKGPSDAFVLKLSSDGSNVIFASYLGGNKNSIYGGTEEAKSIAIGQSGSIYITGDTDSKDFPTTAGAIQTSHKGGDGISEAFIAKYSSGGALSYSTYLGGVGMDNGTGIALDSEENIYVCGGTQSRDFPTTEGAYSTTYNDKIADVFVIKLNSAGTAAYFSTYLGGYFPQANAITVDKFGNSFIAGTGVYKLSPDGSQLIYNKVINWLSQINAIEVDNSGNAYVTGITDRIDFPTVNPTQASLASGYCSEFAGDCPDAFVSIINADGTELLFSTYLGGGGWGSEDEGHGIALGPNGTFYAAGMTRSEEFPTKNAFRTNYSGGFLVKYGKIQSDENLIYDQVMRGDLPIFTPLIPPASHQIVQQYQFQQFGDTLTYLFEGKITDERVGLRIKNTRLNSDEKFPLKLGAIVVDPENGNVGLLPLPFTHPDNIGIQFNVNKNGLYKIRVFLKEDSAKTKYPAPFEILLSGDVGLPRKLINEEPEIKRGTRLDILFNHPAPRRQILAGKNVSVAQTGLFKFANPVSVSNYAIAVMLPPERNGYPLGKAVIRAADPVIIGQLNANDIDITTPTARTTEWNLPQIGSIIDFTQVPLPHSVEEWPPLPPLQGTVCSVIWENDGREVSLPLEAVNGSLSSLILDMGSGQEIVDGEGNDLIIYSSTGTYGAAISNCPNSGTFKFIGNALSGNQELDITSSGLTSARYVLIVSEESVSLDAVKALNQFMDGNRVDIGPAVDAEEATIIMRREKAPLLEFDPFLELIAPDGSKLGDNESGFADNTSLDLSDAALIGIGLSQVGFHRFLGRGYDQVPNDQSFGTYFVHLETGGIFDADDIVISSKDEIILDAQKKGNITKTRQRDSYKFQTEPGTRVNIVVNALDETLNPIIELYDPDDFLLGANDDYPGRARNSALSILLPDSSFMGRDKLPNPITYRIVVSGIDKAGVKTTLENINYYKREVSGGGYELKVFTGDLEGNNPEVVNLAWEAPSSGETIAPPSNLTAQQSVSNLSKSIKKQNINNVIVERKYPSKNITSNIESQISKTNFIDEIEPNNNLDQSQVLNGDQLILVNGNAEVEDVGAITINGDDIEDLFKVTIYTDTLDVFLYEFTSDCDLYLLNASGELIMSSAFSEATQPEGFYIEDLSAGTYLVGVSINDSNPGGGNTTSYTLVLTGKFEGVNNSSLQSYNIYRSTSPNAKNTGTLLSNVAATETKYTDQVPFEGDYYYQVTAVYDQGESIPTNDALVTVTDIMEEDHSNIPNKFELFQNYPNPFNPTTTIKYSIPKQSNVTLKVFDILGSEVKTLVNKEHSQGNYEIEFDGAELTSGIYFYRLQAGDYAETKKMILLK